MPDISQTDTLARPAPGRSLPDGMLASAFAAASLAGCAQGDTAPGPTNSDGVGSALVTKSLRVAVSDRDAARFLLQASTGADAASIARVRAIGFSAWLDEQLATPRGVGVWDWMVSKGYNVAANGNSQIGIDAALWRSLIASNDTLRQRVALALSEIMVVGIDGLNISWRNFVAAAYMDLLQDHAFGNFRDLLQAVSTSVGMGVYLTFRGNLKANPKVGSLPDENYAREVMQLFTIGLYQLNEDGSPKLRAGAPQETYSQSDILGLARVFTGWDLDGTDNTTPDRMRRPMIQYPSRHESGEKNFLGVTIAAGTDGVRSMKIALDTIFAHPNMPPFIGRQLIQRLVTSNPSPAYVGRVAGVFRNNGSGVRGDLSATVRAILLDREARSATNIGVGSFGKLREPILRFTAWARACKAKAMTDAWTIGNTSDPGTRLGQSPLRSATVFNFFRPGYVPPNSALALAHLVAPEFQITNESTLVAYVNFMQSVVANGVGDVKPDYTDLLALAKTPSALVTQLNLLLAAGELAPAAASEIETAIASIVVTSAAGLLNRTRAAVFLILATPECMAQK